MIAPVGGATPARPPAVARVSLQGRYAGFASRFVAFIVDEGTATGLFALALATISFVAQVLTGKPIHWNRSDFWVTLAFVGWQFLYFAYSWAASGKTFGMAVFGIRVVRPDGTDASWRQAVVCTLALPLSFLLSGSDFSASSWTTSAGRCTMSSPGRQSSTHGMRGRRGCDSCPEADPLPIVLPCTSRPLRASHAIPLRRA
jgi:uncharacterized RDD family membrane protein YckC